MKYYFLLSLSLFAVSILNAQGGFEKGYVLNANGDTLKGEVKVNPKKPMDAFNKAVLRDQNGLMKTYKPEKVKGYGVGTENYVAMNSDGEMKFFRILALGEVNFYKLMFEAVQMNSTVYEYEYYLSPPDNKKLTVVKESKFRKQLVEWLKDSPEMANEYPEEKKFNEEKATDIIQRYNSSKK